MPDAAHHRARTAGTIGAAASHGYLAILASNELLNYTVPTRYRLVDEIASDFLWGWMHLLAMLLLIVAAWRPHMWYGGRHINFAAIACSLGFAFMGTWAFFHLLWGLSATRPVSLAGPGLAFVVAAGEHLLAAAWRRGTYNKGR